MRHTILLIVSLVMTAMAFLPTSFIHIDDGRGYQLKSSHVAAMGVTFNKVAERERVPLTNREIGQYEAAKVGWTGGQWDCLEALWNGESGWNEFAYNASSGAGGIPQSLPMSKMASVASDYETNPWTQIQWGIGYIQAVYGSPCNAYSQWLSRSPNHWY